MNYFEKLSPTIIEIIFKKLNLVDLIYLRYLNKKFKKIIEQIKIEEMFIHVIDSSSNFKIEPIRPHLKLWFYENDLTYFEENIIIEDGKLLNRFRPKDFINRFKLNKNLKRLSLKLDDISYFTILNDFKLLEHLNISIDKCNFGDELNLEDFKIFGNKKNQNKINFGGELNLKNLKIFEIQNKKINFTDLYDIFFSNLKFVLNTINLIAFKSLELQFNNFEFKYPHKILVYEGDNYYDNRIKKFINLKNLKLIDSSNLDNELIKELLIKFENLKSFEIIESTADLMEQLTFDNLKNNINFLIEQKKKLKKSALKIYFYGVELNNQNKINLPIWSSDQLIDDLFKFQIINYNRLKDNCCYRTSFNYCELVKHFKIIPSNLINKFSNVNHIYANEHINNEDQFIKFLNQLPYLFKLELINCGSAKSFYDKLINLVYLYNLKNLIIEEQEDLNLDLNFILNLKQLTFFNTNQIINFEIIDNLFKIKNNIIEIDFKINSKNSIQIRKDVNSFELDTYELDFFDQLDKIQNLSFKKLKLDQLLSKLKSLKSNDLKSVF